HIIPDILNKTQLGRDLLAEDYILKQVGASLIYPESRLGKEFWNKVYDEAYRKFGVTQIPVNVINKIWILPEKATVYEKGDTVYILHAHLKVMLDEDYQAQRLLIGNASHGQADNAQTKDISRQVLREVLLPAVEKAVNENKNFARVRQVFYSLILAQWYQEAFKQSILNKDFSGRDKVSGIDLNNPKNKELIYHRYLASYKRGVFNFIKEETDRFSNQPIPRKYFSGGFVDQPVHFTRASDGDLAMAAGTENDVDIQVVFNPSPAESYSNWYDLNRPWGLLDELKGLLNKRGKFNRAGLYAFIDKYSAYVQSQRLYPVQSAWPVLKAITLLSKAQEDDLIKALQKKYKGKKQPELVDKIFLMNRIFDRKTWLADKRPNLQGRAIYMLAAEIHYWTGGLGPVMEFHGKGMHDLGADVNYIEPDYQLDINGNPLDYAAPNQGIRDLNNDFDDFDIQIGNSDGNGYKQVHVRVAKGIDKNGIATYLIRDVQADGSSYYTKMLYNYSAKNNPVSKEESMAFLNIASAELIKRLETNRRQAMEQQGQTWEPAIVHGNDGQFGPLEAVTMSRFGSDDAVKNIVWAYTTHTDLNRGGNGDVKWAVDVFLKHMMGIKDFYINAFRRGVQYIDYTSGGGRLADFFGAVANSHADRMRGNDPNSVLVAVTNGAVPEEMAAVYREEFKKLQQENVIPQNADFERPTAREEALTKRASKVRLNAAGIMTANGGFVHVDLDRPVLGYVRRLVPEKAGRQRALTDDNIWMLVQLGYDVVLLGNNQHTEASEKLAAELKSLENKIADEKNKRPQDFPGSFQFVQSITREEKILFLAALDVEIQDSDDNEANGAWEEDGTANGAYVGSGTWRTGVLADQGIPVDFNHPGKGNILMPRQDTSHAWLDTVYKPLIGLWNKDPEHLEFYQNAALGPRLNRIAYYLLTSAAYLKEYEMVIEHRKREAKLDKDTQERIVEALGDDQQTINGILNTGRNGVKSFKFSVIGVPEVFEEKGSGIKAFIAEEKSLENRFGYNALLSYYLGRNFQKFLEGLFAHSGASGILHDWIMNLDNDEVLSVEQKEARLRRFVGGLVRDLENKLQTLKGADAAMANPGGIKFTNITLQRQGSLFGPIVSNKALGAMLLKAQGLYGVIVGVTPIPNLLKFIQ
ncbi:MAG: glycogen/starch synthase, partial [Candidatus Omnitrophica bacterium]|nr:glycogen/starch synthase [Candidatus Omnitrophota bacterium]